MANEEYPERAECDFSLVQKIREAEGQQSFDFPPVPQPQQVPQDYVKAGGCPHHSIFVYGCPFLTTRNRLAKEANHLLFSLWYTTYYE